MIRERPDRQGTAGRSDWLAKLKEVTERLVRMIVKTAALFGNVEVGWDGMTRRQGVGAGRILTLGIESN